ncbi:MAG: ribonuclease HI [Anaerolineales bacterium]
MPKIGYYAVVRGNKPGIYTKWFGEDGAEIQVKGFYGAKYKGFPTLEEAQQWFESVTSTAKASQTVSQETPSSTNQETFKQLSILNTQPSSSKTDERKKENDIYVIYTDGACIGNPGKGGYGVVILHNGKRQEYSGGYRHTTNNRMELMACIVGLEQIPPDSFVVIYSDSQYVVNGIERGWAIRWRAKGWFRTKDKKAENIDLWDRLLTLYEQNQVEFRWVRGHIGNPENERCNKLAQIAASRNDNPIDSGYKA